MFSYYSRQLGANLGGTRPHLISLNIPAEDSELGDHYPSHDVHGDDVDNLEIVINRLG